MGQTKQTINQTVMEKSLDREDFVLVNHKLGEYLDKYAGKPIGFFEDSVRRLCRNKASLTAIIIILIITFMAIFGPMMNPYGFNDQHVDYVNLPPRIPVLSELGIMDGTKILYNRRADNLTDTSKYPEGSVIEIVNEYEVNGVKMVDIKVDAYLMAGADKDTNFWMGTDYLGRDLWTRLWRGARVSLLIAVVAVFVNICIGLVYGSISGYYGGKVDMIMMRITEIISAFPQSIMATMLILVLGRGTSAIVLAKKIYQ